MHCESSTHPNESSTPAPPHAPTGRVATLEPPAAPPAAKEDEHLEHNKTTEFETELGLLNSTPKCSLKFKVHTHDPPPNSGPPPDWDIGIQIENPLREKKFPVAQAGLLILNALFGIPKYENDLIITERINKEPKLFY